MKDEVISTIVWEEQDRVQSSIVHIVGVGYFVLR